MRLTFSRNFVSFCTSIVLELRESGKLKKRPEGTRGREKRVALKYLQIKVDQISARMIQLAPPFRGELNHALRCIIAWLN
jgi:hypothetical protein